MAYRRAFLGVLESTRRAPIQMFFMLRWKWAPAWELVEKNKLLVVQLQVRARRQRYLLHHLPPQRPVLLPRQLPRHPIRRNQGFGARMTRAKHGDSLATKTIGRCITARFGSIRKTRKMFSSADSISVSRLTVARLSNHCNRELPTAITTRSGSIRRMVIMY